MYLSQFSLTLFIFLSLLLAHSRSSARLHLVLSLTCWDFSLLSLGLHIFTPRDFTSSAHLHWPLYLFHHLFLLFSLSHSSYQVTINASQLILTLLQPISFLQLSLSRMTLASFFSFILPTCLTSLTSHIHLCDLTFVHPFIKVAALLYIITEKKRRKDEPNFFSFGQAAPANPFHFADFSALVQTSSFNELRQSVGWNMVQRTQK